jgi:hypothetical protein
LAFYKKRGLKLLRTSRCPDLRMGLHLTLKIWLVVF